MTRLDDTTLTDEGTGTNADTGTETDAGAHRTGTDAVTDPATDADAPTAPPPVDRTRDVERDRFRFRTVLVVLVTAAMLAGGLLAANDMLFSVAHYEAGDAAANSLLVRDAKELDLMVGHYSRVGFNHPGPVLLYVQAAGEWLFTDVLDLTPAPFNGQAAALILLAALVLAAVVGLLHTWTRSWAIAAAGGAVILLDFAQRRFSLASWWEPDLVQPYFLLLLVATASVASGRARHLPVLAAVGGLLVHSHVQFVAFVPVLAGGALVALAVQAGGPRRLWATQRRALLAAAAVIAAFLAPIVLHTVLHWPGEIGNYIERPGAGKTPRTLLDALHYARDFWPSDGIAPPLLLVAAGGAAALLALPPARRALLALFAAAVVAQGMFVVYAYLGIDDLTQDYVGFFIEAVPLAMWLCVTVCIGTRLLALDRRRVGETVLGAAAVVVAVATLARADFGLRVPGLHDVPQLVAAIEGAAAGRPVVLTIRDREGPRVVGPALLLQLERDGREVCQDDPDLAIYLTPERLCSPEEARQGARVLVTDPGLLPEPLARTGGADLGLLR